MLGERLPRINTAEFIKTALGIYLMGVVFIFAYLLLEFWPVYRSAEEIWEDTETLWIVGGPFTVADEIRLLILVVISAGLGSCIHTATSFATYLGNKSFVTSWAWWYVLRPFIGMALALVFYFVIRGGLLSVQSDANDFNPYGVAAVAGLVGIFSKQATDKLEEVFTNMFRTAEGRGDDKRRDKLGETIPVIEKMVPLRKIKKVTLPKDRTEKDIKLPDLFRILDEGRTRVPIFDEKDVCKYIIHQSLIYKFVASVARKSAANPAEGNRTVLPAAIEGNRLEGNVVPLVGSGNVLDELTLEDFLKFGDAVDYVRDGLAAVSRTATLGDAQAAMAKVENCQDVLVTTTGEMDGAVVGWLTNGDIARHINS